MIEDLLTLVLKPINGCPGYLAGNDGNIWSTHGKGSDTPYKLRPAMTKGGYLTVGLWINNRIMSFKVHRLILKTFKGDCPNGMEACHNNGIKVDNRSVNLRWDTKEHNQEDSIRLGKISYIGLNTPKVRVIKHLLKSGKVTMVFISKAFDVSYSTILNIKYSRTWKHIQI